MIYNTRKSQDLNQEFNGFKNSLSACLESEKTKQILFHPFGKLSSSILARCILLLVRSSKEKRQPAASLSASQWVADSLGPSPCFWFSMIWLSVYTLSSSTIQPERDRSFWLHILVSLFLLRLLPCLSIINSRSSPKLTSIKLVMPSSHLILCRLLLLLPPIPPSIRVFAWGGQSIGVSAQHESCQWTSRTDLL